MRNLWQVVQDSWTRKCPPGRCHSEALARKRRDSATGSSFLSTITNLHTQLCWGEGFWQSCIHLGTLLQPVQRSFEHLSKAQIRIPCSQSQSAAKHSQRYDPSPLSETIICCKKSFHFLFSPTWHTKRSK